MYSVQNTIEVLDFALEFGMGLDKSLEDNKLSLLDVPNFYGAIAKAGPAFKDFNLVPKELGDMDATERAQVLAHVASKLSLDNDRTEAIVVEGLAFAAQLHKLLGVIKRKEA